MPREPTADNPTNAPPDIGHELLAAGERVRLDALDVLRGVVMALMALDHVREYLHASLGVDPTDPSRASPVLFATRWMTHLCAPTFVLLAGASIWLRGSATQQRAPQTRYLITRGLWLIALELTVVGTGFTFDPGRLFLQVIWVIGASMILLAALERLPVRAVLATGIAIIACGGLLPIPAPGPVGGTGILAALLDGRFSVVEIGPLQGVVLYSLLGWFGIMCLGYGLGPLLRRPGRERRRGLAVAGSAMLVLFAMLRLHNVYGDPAPWSVEPTWARQAMSFLRVSKYPPSLDFTLVTVGASLLALAALDGVRSRVTRMLRTFGRVPLFFYVIHIYLIHGIAAGVGVVQGRAFAEFTDPLNPPRDFGFSLPVVYGIWLAVLALLLPLCRWFEGVKRERRSWWLAYI